MYVCLVAQKQSAVMHSYWIATLHSRAGHRQVLALHVHQYMLLKAALAVLMEATSYGMHWLHSHTVHTDVTDEASSTFWVVPFLHVPQHMQDSTFEHETVYTEEEGLDSIEYAVLPVC